MSERCEDCGEPLPHAAPTCIDKLNERRLFWQGRYQDTQVEVERLREALRHEWLMNHDERCTNMEDCESFGDTGKRCYHPRPVALGDTEHEQGVTGKDY